MLLPFSHFFSLFFLFVLLPASDAHAAVAPQLGVDGTPSRSDVKRPSKNKPCGDGVNIAAVLDTSTAVPASANGDVTVTVLNFNPAADGSRKVTANVDPSGAGQNFVQMTITINGDPAPKQTGSQDVVAKLPPGTQCVGGSKKNKCLVQFITSSGFGNCVVVSQGPGAGKTSSTSPAARAASPSNVGLDISDRAVGGADATTKKDSKKLGGKKKKQGKKKNAGKNKVAAKKVARNSDSGSGKGGKKNAGKKKQKKGGNKKHAGTRAPRALLADLEQDARAADVVE